MTGKGAARTNLGSEPRGGEAETVRTWGGEYYSH
jgi:hypothetical protein